MEKGIQHRFDLSLEKFKAKLKGASDSRLEDGKNRFVIGATSHMANTLFDKHVEFCEKYVEEMQKALAVLVFQGPTEERYRDIGSERDIKKKLTVLLDCTVRSSMKVLYQKV